MKAKQFMTILLILAAAVSNAGAGEFYLSPEGSDQNPGTKDSPFKSIERARQAAQEIDKSQPGQTVVYFRDGFYVLEQTVEFGPQDSGSATHPVVYMAYPGEKPVISGGRRLEGWQKGGQAIWQAPMGNDDFRQLYVGGEKAPRARFPNAGQYFNLTSWDEKNRAILLPQATMQDWRDFDEVEIHIQMVWSVAIMRLESFSQVENGLELTVTNPERDLVFKRQYPRKLPNQSFHFENAREFINMPGEWSLNRSDGFCYYLPRPGEDMNTVEVIIPHLETLFSIQGTLDEPVRHLRFKGLTFKHSNWARPNDKGYLNVQAGQYTIEPTVGNNQYVERPPAAVYAAAVHNVVFERNVFEQIGSTALDIHYGSFECEVAGNVFYDIAGTAISHARLSDGWEIHVPYNPEDPRDRSVNDHIHNNYMESIGHEYGGAIGILSGYATAVRIEYNELRNLAYSGISLGWGWTSEPNAMRDNVIHANWIDHPVTKFTDGAGVYTLSEMPGSVISRNFVSNVIRSKFATSFHQSKAYYLDELSGGITFKENWWHNVGSGERIFFHLPGLITVTPHGRELVPVIQAGAGLQPDFTDIRRQPDWR